MKTEPSQEQYNNIFKDLKKEKMNWDFDDFIKKTEHPQKSEPEIPIKEKSNQPIFSKLFWMAASLALVLGIFFLTKYYNNSSTIDKTNTIVQEEILKEKNNSEFLAINETPKDSTMVKEKDSTRESNYNAEKKAEELMDKILSKKSRLKKNSRLRLAKVESPNQKNDKEEFEYQNNYVIINGQKIENEKDAIDVTKYSLQILTNQVAKTIANVEQPHYDNE